MRHRAMGGNPGHNGAKPKCALVADHRTVRGRLSHDDGAGRSKNSCARQMERAFATDFLTSGDHEDNAACLARLRGHAADRGNKGGNTALHVSCAAAIELAIDDIARERIKIPRSITERNGIDMTGEAKR